LADDKQRNWWFVALGLVLLSLAFAVVATLVLEPAALEKPVPHAQPDPWPVATPAVIEPPPSSPEPAPAPPPAAEEPQRVEPAAPATCARAADCRGPKTADCVAANCEAGRCVFDRSRCECAGDDECDDGVECTRDLCFAATQKCIHIRSDCE